jgi:hypothetical protein
MNSASGGLVSVNGNEGKIESHVESNKDEKFNLTFQKLPSKKVWLSLPWLLDSKKRCNFKLLSNPENILPNCLFVLALRPKHMFLVYKNLNF